MAFLASLGFIADLALFYGLGSSPSFSDINLGFISARAIALPLVTLLLKLFLGTIFSWNRIIGQTLVLGAIILSISLNINWQQDNSDNHDILH